MINDFMFPGNDNIHVISTRSKTELRVDLEDWVGAKAYAKYQRFYIEGGGSQYKLHIVGYSGNAGVYATMPNVLHLHMYDILSASPL